MADAQKKAAATPQSLVIPLPPVGSGGKGPVLVLPTFTPFPTPTPEPTSTPQPMATPGQLMPTTSDLVVTAQANGDGKVNPVSHEPVPTPAAPPPTGSFWLLPLGLVLAGKGLLNLLGLMLRP
jgi:hypothetical protein